MRTFLLILAALILGLGGGYLWSKESRPTPAEAMNTAKAPSAKPGQTAHEIEETGYYADCDAAEKAGKSPLWTGQPGYRKELDPDGDGLACTPSS